MNALHQARARITDRIRKFFNDEQGATAVEYGLLVAAIAAVIVVVVFALGEKINTAFALINSTLP